jgi:hypothetical protein
MQELSKHIRHPWVRPAKQPDEIRDIFDGDFLATHLVHTKEDSNLIYSLSTGLSTRLLTRFIISNHFSSHYQ